jgi:predicted outer membrane protein
MARPFPPGFIPIRQENIMQQNKVLKGLLAVSAVAAMLATAGVQAQTTETKSAGQPSTSTTGTMRQDMGKDQKSMDKDQKSMGKENMSGSSQGGTGMAGGTAAAGSMSKADQKILMSIAQANMAEIEAGKMAQSKSQNDEVKKFAQQMIDDHSGAQKDVEQLAQQKGVTLPTEPDAKHKAMAVRLDKMSGDEFDKAYMAQAGVSDHKKVHAMLVQDEKRAKDADLKALVSKMAPAVEQHLKSAEQMHMAKSGTTSGK